MIFPDLKYIYLKFKIILLSLKKTFRKNPNKTIVLEDRFTFHQRMFTLLALGGPFLYVCMDLWLVESLTLTGKSIFMFCLIFYICLFLFLHLDRGFQGKNDDLYRTSFFFNIPVFRTKINVKDDVKVTFLKKKIFRKYAFISIARPDWGKEKWYYEIYLLNENHTKKDFLLRLESEENVEDAIDFLNENFNLVFEEYHPKFE